MDSQECLPWFTPGTHKKPDFGQHLPLEVASSKSQQILEYRLAAHLTRGIAKWISVGNGIQAAR